MSPQIFNCPLCGWMICDEDGSVVWSNQFRGLYKSRDEGIVLTGLGLYADTQSGAFIAPRDPSARWDDPGYTSPWEDQFGVMTQSERNGRRGFVFHDACWTLLKQMYSPVAVPHERLFEVFDSIPMVMAGDSMDWGHDYGGLARLEDENNYFPWENLRFADRDFGDGWFRTLYHTDPLTAASEEIEEILVNTAQQPFPWSNSSSSTTTGYDPFNNFSDELCFAIAVYLPTSDLLNVRLASRSFCHVFYSQSFWASRFRGRSSERSWLFEAGQALEKPGGVGVRDWRWLYRRTFDVHLGPATHNRKRVWALLSEVADILDLSWNESPSDLQWPWRLPPFPKEPSPGPSWILAAGSVQHRASESADAGPLQKDYSRLKVQRVSIPVDIISRVAVSTVRLGRFVYIAGVSFAASSGEVLMLGYRTGAGESSTRLLGTALTGLNLSVGLGGIHALQCISGTGTERQLSPWLGCPDDGPKTKRLSHLEGERTVVLEFGFDGFRMVSIAAQQPTSQMGLDHSISGSAMWYPGVPPPTLSLNEEFLLAPQTYASGYRPLFWACFGGPGGIYLKNLTKISLIGTVERMEFSFDDPEVPSECHSFGRVGDRVDIGNDEVVFFMIDGPGGEVINRVKIGQELFLQSFNDALKGEGHLAWLKLYTNRGRSCEVGRRKSRSSKRPIVEKEIHAPFITGFYAAQVLQ